MRRRIALILALAAMLLAFTGCSMTDYQMTWDIMPTAQANGQVTVSYTLYNAGLKPLENAMIRIEATATTMVAGPSTGTAWTSPTSLEVGETYSSTIVITVSPYSAAYTGSSAIVTAAGWDESGGSNIF